MKNILLSLSLLFAFSLFIQAGCSKDGDTIDTTPPPGADQYITWNLNGTKGYLAAPSDTLWASTSYGPTVIFGLSPATNANFYASIAGAEVAMKQALSVMIFADGKYYVPGTSPIWINVTHYGAVGDYVTGSYSGELKDSLSPAKYNLNGMFRVKRK